MCRNVENRTLRKWYLECNLLKIDLPLFPLFNTQKCEYIWLFIFYISWCFGQRIINWKCINISLSSNLKTQSHTILVKFCGFSTSRKKYGSLPQSLRKTSKCYNILWNCWGNPKTLGVFPRPEKISGFCAISPMFSIVFPPKFTQTGQSFS